MILFVDKDTTLFRSSSICYRGWLYEWDILLCRDIARLLLGGALRATAPILSLRLS